jgi:protein-S-isoprenylcysteine O-methyltransferase Ste14
LTHTANDRGKGYVFVAIQFTLIGLIIISVVLENVYLHHAVSSISRIAGIILLITSLFVIIVTLSNFKQMVTPNPVPRDSAVLITNGIYKYIRHPMYLSALSGLIGLALFYCSYYALILCAAGIFFITIKIKYEETFLTAKFPQYKEYSLKSKKLLPFIY